MLKPDGNVVKMLPLILLLGATIVSGAFVPGGNLGKDKCGYKSCVQAEPGVLNVHIVPHTHDDVGWLKTVDQYYYGSRNNIQQAGVQYILDSVVKELWQDPKRRFMYVETAFFWKWWVRQDDHVKHKVHALVRQGRLQFVGGAWSMNDEAATHYQSTVDQFTWGLRKLNETFGPCGLPRVGWQIDPFGHAREFASLLAAMGYDGLFLGRIDYQDKKSRLANKTMEMLWRGDDDLGKPSDIFTGALYNTYSPPPGFCFDVLCSDEPIIDDPDSPMFNVDERVMRFLDIARNMSKGYSTNNVLVTMGEDFFYQDAHVWYSNLDKLIQYVRFSTKSARWHLRTSPTTSSRRWAMTFSTKTPPCGLLIWTNLYNKFLKYVTDQSKQYLTSNVVVTMGGDFTYQDASMWYKNLDKLIEYANLKAAKDGLNIKLFYSTPDCYLKAVKDAKPALPTKQDDFFPYASDPTAYWTGYFTSRPTTKYFEREGNSFLQMVKQLQVLGGLEEHNRFVIDELKSAMGVMQHHDAITGTEKQHVTHDYERILSAAMEDAALVARQAFNKIIQRDANKPPIFSFDRCHLNESSCYTSETSDTFVVTIYNPLAWGLEEAIRIPVVEGSYAVFAPNGDQIDSQLVEIPDAVLKIPTRISMATHEIVFIAKLHGLGVKSFYIKKANKVKRHLANSDADKKRQNDYYANVNDYWKDIKEQPYVDIKNIEDEQLKDVDFKNNINERIPILTNKGASSLFEEVIFNTDKDLEMLKDVKDTFDEKAKEFQLLVRDTESEAKGKTRVNMEKNLHFPTLNDEEMRMLSDEPKIVERLDEFYLENEHMKLRFDKITGELTHVILPDRTINIKIKMYYWTGCVGDNSNTTQRSSGAYIFRPKTTSPIELPYKNTINIKGPVVQETRIELDTAAISVRIYTGLPFFELDFVVGPIPIEDKVGKEYIVRYETNVVNNGIFYTDSNGRQMLKRKLNERPQWNLTLEEPIAGNYYPVTNRIFIKDNENRVSVLTDRAQGGTSLVEGNIELMLHRRLLHDDAFGVGEALNETASGKGLVMRGRHRLMFRNPSNYEELLDERKQVLQLHLQPQIFVSKTTMDYKDWLTLNNCFKGMKAKLPSGVHLLTLEPWSDKKLLLRLENYMDKTSNSTIEVDLTKIFSDVNVKSFKETTLAANQWLEDYNKWSWNIQNKFTERFNDAYDNFNNIKYAKDDVEIVEDNGLNIKLKAKQIRTFVVDYDMAA